MFLRGFISFRSGLRFRQQAGLVCLLIPLLFVGCLWLEPSTLSLIYGEEVIDREQAKNDLRTAVRLNVGICSENKDPGLFAIEFLIPNELNHLRYFRKSIDDCAVALMIVPCGASIQIDTEDQDQVDTQLFLPILRSCNPRPIPENPLD